MKALCKKLKSSDGASMLIALIFLLTALVLGAVSLAAASANAGRAGRNVTEQQVYYAIDSAAGLVKSEMSSASFTSSSYTTTTEQWKTDGFSDPRSSSGTSFQVSPDSALIYALKNELQSFYSTGGLQGVSETTTIPLSFSAGENMPAVDCLLTLYRGGGTDGVLEFQLYVAGGDECSGQMTLRFAPYIDSSDDRSETTVNGTHTVTETHSSVVSWGEPEVTKG